MFTPWTLARLNERTKVFHIVWFALLVSQALLGMVLFLQRQAYEAAGTAPSGDTLLQEPFAQVLAFGGFAAFVASRVLDRFMFSTPQLQKFKREPWTTESLGKLRTPQGAPLFRDSEIAEMLVLPEPDRLVFRATPLYFQLKIVQWALCDLCGIFGFMLATTRMFPVAFVPFAALAVFGMISTRPRQQDIIDFVKLPA